jgi:hypothetical protein
MEPVVNGTAPFVCVITGEPFVDPVHAADGFVYEREAILQWFNSGANAGAATVRSPRSGVPMAKRIYRSFEFYQQYKAWCAAHGLPAPFQPEKFGEVDIAPPTQRAEERPLVTLRETVFDRSSVYDCVQLVASDLPAPVYIEVLNTNDAHRRRIEQLRRAFNPERSATLQERLRSLSKPLLDIISSRICGFIYMAAPLVRDYIEETVHALAADGIPVTLGDVMRSPSRKIIRRPFCCGADAHRLELSLTPVHFYMMFAIYRRTTGDLVASLTTLPKYKIGCVAEMNGIPRETLADAIGGSISACRKDVLVKHLVELLLRTTAAAETPGTGPITRITE